MSQMAEELDVILLPPRVVKYSEDQPRVPAGSPEGGEFGGAGTGPYWPTEDERLAIDNYILGSGAGVNHPLRGVTQPGAHYEHADAEIKAIDHAMARSTLPEMEVRRGCNKLDGFTPVTIATAVGTVVTDKGYLSTSKGSGFTGTDMRLFIHVPEGVHGLDMSESINADEKEVLLDRGAKLRIDSVEAGTTGAGDPQMKVTATVMP